MIYEWKPGARLSGLDAQKVGDRLQTICVKHGAITPTLVVKEAKKKTSPLHGGFEWDDRRAAQEYRLDQARLIVRSVIVHRDGNDGEPMAVRAFVHIGEASDYEDIDVVLGIPEKREALLAQALAELEIVRRKYETLEELAGVFAAMDRAKAA